MLALLNLMFRPKAVQSHDLFTTLLAATNLSCKPQHHLRKLVSRNTKILVACRRGCPSRLPPGRRSLTPRPCKLFPLSCIQEKGCGYRLCASGKHNPTISVLVWARIVLQYAFDLA